MKRKLRRQLEIFQTWIYFVSNRIIKINSIDESPKCRDILSVFCSPLLPHIRCNPATSGTWPECSRARSCGTLFAPWHSSNIPTRQLLWAHTWRWLVRSEVEGCSRTGCSSRKPRRDVTRGCITGSSSETRLTIRLQFAFYFTRDQIQTFKYWRNLLVNTYSLITQLAWKIWTSTSGLKTITRCDACYVTFNRLTTATVEFLGFGSFRENSRAKSWNTYPVNWLSFRRFVSSEMLVFVCVFVLCKMTKLVFLSLSRLPKENNA